MVIYSAMETMA